MKKERFGRITSGALEGQRILVTDIRTVAERYPIYTMGNDSPHTYMRGRRETHIEFLLPQIVFDERLTEGRFSLRIDHVDGKYSFTNVEKAYLYSHSHSTPLVSNLVKCVCVADDMHMVEVMEEENTSYISLLKTGEDF